MYNWAGKLRTIDLTRGGTTFAHHADIESGAVTIFNQLAGEQNLAGLPPDRFSERTAYYLGELNALHPFREGNGRAQREFVSQVAQANGYSTNWDNVSQAEMLEAAIESFSGDSLKLAQIIHENMAEAERPVDQIEQAHRQGPDGER